MDAPATIPPRGTMDRTTALAHVTPRHKIGIAQMLLIAAVLAIAIDLATPKPNVVLQSVAYDAPGCLGSGTSQNVTATFTLVNRGAVDAVVQVTLSADGNSWVTADFGVPASGSAPGRLQGTLPDCSVHRFSVSFTYPGYGGG